jgi:UDP-N-acetylglucosamine 1-carboxyvinyltransferase
LQKLIIQGGTKLNGRIRISGSKNSSLPAMAASLLTDKKIIIHNLPHLVDISIMANLLATLGTGVEIVDDGMLDGARGRTLSFKTKKLKSDTAPYDLVSRMRASILVLGPLVGRFGKAIVSLPGGCAIGTRPVGLHLQALEALGAKIDIKDGYIHAFAKGGLKGAKIDFAKITVTGTANAIMAASLAKGTTIITNAAIEPEVTNLIAMLQQMGANIEITAERTIQIIGVKNLHGAEITMIPDRVEAGTFAIAALITNGKLELDNIDMEIFDPIKKELKKAGAKLTATKTGVIIESTKKNFKAFNIETMAFPGFPTDMQAQFMALLSIAEGKSKITESIFENRFMHVAELRRMGADIEDNGNEAIIKGVKTLKGAEVMATDLRASVALVLAAMAAKGETTLTRIYHLDRGYENLEEKLRKCGAKIHRSS